MVWNSTQSTETQKVTVPKHIWEHGGTNSKQKNQVKYSAMILLFLVAVITQTSMVLEASGKGTLVLYGIIG